MSPWPTARPTKKAPTAKPTKKGSPTPAPQLSCSLAGPKTSGFPKTGKCLKCEAMNKKAREEAEAAMARDTAE